MEERLRLKQLFGAAIALPPEDRPPFLDGVCSNEPELRAELESLLKFSDLVGDFLEQPASLESVAGLRLSPFDSVDRLEPQRLGPYEILAPIGGGGMGRVYRARDVRLDRIVALKVLPAAAAADADARRRFEQEARAISKLNHPNICALYDVGQYEGVDFLVMEYLEGDTLAARVAKGPLPPGSMLRCGMEIADALDRAHQAGIIHRDLKPSNIVLTESGAKLLDFGIAKLHDRDLEAGSHATGDSDSALTQRGRIIGTAAYMSPEQVRGEVIDARSDLFSFGAVLYEMAVGRRAFQGTSTETVCAAVLEGAPPLTDPGFAALTGIADIIRRTLETDRTKRYQRASDLKMDLQRLVRTAEASVPVGGRRTTPKLAAAAVLTALLSVSGFLLAHNLPSVRSAIGLLFDVSMITTVAGGGTPTPGFCGDEGPGISACLHWPSSVAVDTAGNVLISDGFNNRVRRVDAVDGTIMTVAGSGAPMPAGGFCGDGGPATNACFYWIAGVAVDAGGNVFIADYGNHRIRKIEADTRIITTVAGSGTRGFCGDGGLASNACLDSPHGIAVDADGNVSFSDRGNNRIRRVDAVTRIITTVAGNGSAAFCGDGGLATGACLNSPTGVAVDATSNWLIADLFNHRIRRVDAATRFITTVAGNGSAAFCGDSGLATGACLNSPSDVAVDAAGNWLIADRVNQRIRRVDATTKRITTVAGRDMAGFCGDGDWASRACLFNPGGVAVDPVSGGLLIADTDNHRVRRSRVLYRDGLTLGKPPETPE